MNASASLNACLWAPERIAAGLHALAIHTGLLDRHAGPVLGGSDPRPAIGTRIEQHAEALGLCATPYDVGASELDTLFRSIGPAAVILPTPAGPRVLLVLRGSARRLSVLRTDGTTCTIATRDLRRRLLDRYRDTAAQIDQHLDQIDVRGRDRSRAAAALFDSFVASKPRIDGIWLLDASSDTPLWPSLRRAGVPAMITTLLATRIGLNLLLVGGWWLLGTGALSGHVERPLLLAWALVLATTIPLRLLDTWSQGRLAIEAGRVIKTYLLQSSFSLDTSVVRTRGVGDLFGRVMESEAVESLSLGGGFSAVVAVVELMFAAAVLATTADAGVLLSLLAGFIGACGVAVYLVHRRNTAWTDERIELTNHLVEQMVGYRTRLAQLPPQRWHSDEDLALQGYLGTSQRLDRSVAGLGLLPIAWLLMGTLAITPTFAAGPLDGAALGVVLGGLLLARGAFASLVSGLSQLSSAKIALDRIAPLLAAKRSAAPPTQPAVRPSPQGDGRLPVLLASEVHFAHPGRQPILRGGELRVHPGDRVLLTGPSGGGKSTLGAILAGLRRPDDGLVLLHGIDHRSLGFDQWRRHVVSCPQYHENHIFSERLAFNVLMGERWPPTPADLERAREVFEELGLGHLLAAMPAGLWETVGEGWPLSHGERARVYIARALLQSPDVTIFDESFAALDPHTLRTVFRCVHKRSKALVMIAHP